VQSFANTTLDYKMGADVKSIARLYTNLFGHDETDHYTATRSSVGNLTIRSTRKVVDFELSTKSIYYNLRGLPINGSNETINQTISNTVSMNNHTIGIQYNMNNRSGTISYYGPKINRSANFKTIDDQFASAKVLALGGVRITLRDVSSKLRKVVHLATINSRLKLIHS